MPLPSLQSLESSFITPLHQGENQHHFFTLDLTPQQQVIFPPAFGFCSGVRSAVKKLAELVQNNPRGSIWLLGEMIHNPEVDAFFRKAGVNVVKTEEIPALFTKADSRDFFVIPAFGLPLKTEQKLRAFVNTEENILDTSCPFVRKVWAEVEKHTDSHTALFIHGKKGHQESEAILSRALERTKTVLLLDKKEQLENLPLPQETKWSLVNQTTMLSEETEAIARRLKEKADKANTTFEQAATICPATRARQEGAIQLCLQAKCDAILILGGIGSSNTTELYNIACHYLGEENCFFLEGKELADNQTEFNHYLPWQKQWKKSPVAKLKIPRLGLLAGASTPDIVIERVLTWLHSRLN